MPNFFSSHYRNNPQGVAITDEFKTVGAPDDPIGRAIPGLQAGGLLHSHCVMDFTGVTPVLDERMYLFTMRSSDRLVEIYHSGTHTGTTLNCKLGIYRAGNNHDGEAEVSDLWAAAGSEADMLVAARTGFVDNSVVPLPRCKTLWEQIGGGGSGDPDPIIDYDVVATFRTVTAVTMGLSLWEVEYKSGGK